jgi:type IV fimbrial biogenesis protein FimT
MIAVALVVVLMVLAVPSFQGVIRTSRATALTNELITALSQARSEAIKRGIPVAVCASSDQASCAGGWQDGWIVFADDDGNGVVADTADILRVFTPVKGTPSITGKTSGGTDVGVVSYLPLGQIDSASALVFKLWLDNCQGQEKRQIDISLGGRVYTSHISCS